MKTGEAGLGIMEFRPVKTVSVSKFSCSLARPARSRSRMPPLLVVVVFGLLANRGDDLGEGVGEVVGEALIFERNLFLIRFCLAVRGAFLSSLRRAGFRD